MCVRAWQQQSLRFANGWGGARAGAGRPRKLGRPNVPHRTRPEHRKAWPVLVTLRTRFRSLRCQFVYPTVRGAIAASNRAGATHQPNAESFRVCEYSVQEEHLHLLVEASSKAALTRGIRGLSIRLAKRVNQLVFQRGKFIADRFHSVALKTPRAVRNALVYVLANHRKHGQSVSSKVDPYSSGPYFPGFVEFAGIDVGTVVARFVPRALAPPAEVPVARAHTWLLAWGWQRHGRLSIWERPKRICR